jgi:hypothetical protein
MYSNKIRKKSNIFKHIIPEKYDHYMQVLSVVYARLSFSSYSINRSKDSTLKRFINLSRNNVTDTTNGRVKLKFFLHSKSFFNSNCTTWALGMILFSKLNKINVSSLARARAKQIRIAHIQQQHNTAKWFYAETVPNQYLQNHQRNVTSKTETHTAKTQLCRKRRFNINTHTNWSKTTVKSAKKTVKASPFISFSIREYSILKKREKIHLIGG